MGGPQGMWHDHFSHWRQITFVSINYCSHDLRTEEQGKPIKQQPWWPRLGPLVFQCTQRDKWVPRNPAAGSYRDTHLVWPPYFCQTLWREDGHSSETTPNKMCLRMLSMSVYRLSVCWWSHSVSHMRILCGCAPELFLAAAPGFSGAESLCRSSRAEAFDQSFFLPPWFTGSTQLQTSSTLPSFSANTHSPPRLRCAIISFNTIAKDIYIYAGVHISSYARICSNIM